MLSLPGDYVNMNVSLPDDCVNMNVILPDDCVNMNVSLPDDCVICVCCHMQQFVSYILSIVNHKHKGFQIPSHGLAFQQLQM
jgi:hypothetical protein